MTRNINISNELSVLKSSLAAQKPESVYTVPSGYFDTLAEKVIKVIKASEAETVGQELEMVAPLLTGVSRKSPYTTPAGYFEGLEEKMMEGVRNAADYQNRDEELKEIAPILIGLKKEAPFSIPEGYFDDLAANAIGNIQAEKKEVKVISISSRKWFRYAAAAIVVGAVAFTGIKLLTKPSNISSPDNAEARIEKKLDNDFKKDKISTEEVESFLDLTESLAVVEAKQVPGIVKPVNAEGYLDDISDDEIVNFLDQLPEETELNMFE